MKGSSVVGLGLAVDSVSAPAEVDSGSGDSSVGAAVFSSEGCCSGEVADGVVSWLEASSVVSDTEVDCSAGLSVACGSTVL